jgi:hypothetical protein
VDLATLATQVITTVSQLFEMHLSGRIDKTVSPDLITYLSPYPALQHKIRIFAQGYSQQLYHNKYACPRTNLAIQVNLDINLS